MKSNIQQRLLGALGRRPVLWSSATALLCALAVLALALLIDSQIVRQDHVQRHVSLSDLYRRVAVDTNQLLERLNARGDTSCSDKSLSAMRVDLFTSEFQRDVGVINDQQQLVCTTTHGRLPAPIPMPEADLASIDPLGRRLAIWVAQRVMADNGVQPATIIQRGPFNTVVDPRVTQTMTKITGLQATLWWRDLAGQQRPVFNSGFEEFLPLEIRALSDLAAGEHLRWLPGMGWMWVVSSPVPQSRLTLQTFTPLVHRGFAWSVPVSLMALAFGLAVAGALRPRLQRLGKVEHRLAGLLRSGAVHCRYQPIMDLGTGLPVGCEVLMRLRDGQEWVSPEQVIPAVVKRGLTWTMDEAVMRRAVAELQSAFGAESTLRVSFNLFPSDIHRERVSKLFRELMASASRPLWQIDLEVIEREFGESIIRELDGLREDGFAVSVDDFGTGYSNLASIRAFSPTYLKIDRSFVTDMELSSVRSSLIPEMVAIARAVGARVIAEGVENVQQSERLRDFGVDYAQGYLFAKPLTIEEFQRFWAQAHAAPSSGGHPAGGPPLQMATV